MREGLAEKAPADAREPDATVATSDASLARDAWQEMRRNPLFVLSAVFVAIVLSMAVAPQLFAGWFGHGNPRACDLSMSAEGPAHGHPFGYDIQGCDMYANVVYGARASVAVGLLATGLCFVVALVLGSSSGYWGGVVDAVISRIGDVFFGFPFVLGAIVLLTTLQSRSIVVVAGVLTLFAWPTATRLMRATVLEVKSADYVLAARAIGARHSTVGSPGTELEFAL